MTAAEKDATPLSPSPTPYDSGDIYLSAPVNVVVTSEMMAAGVRALHHLDNEDDTDEGDTVFRIYAAMDAIYRETE